MTNILQNQKKSNFLKPYKEQALKDIQISIEEWNKFQEKNFFYQIFSKQRGLIIGRLQILCQIFFMFTLDGQKKL